MYLDQTYGPLRLDDMTLWMEHFAGWNSSLPVVVHAESRSLAAAILVASLYSSPCTWRMFPCGKKSCSSA